MPHTQKRDRFRSCQPCMTMMRAMMMIGLMMIMPSLPAMAATWIDGKTATLQALDKITARISTVAAPVGVPQFFGTLQITVDRCAFHPPEEPPESAAFITVRDIGYDDQPPKQIFSGWMFASSPAVSALEHPVYDITVLSCNAD